MGHGGGLNSLVLSSEAGAEADSSTYCGFLAAATDKLLRPWSSHVFWTSFCPECCLGWEITLIYTVADAQSLYYRHGYKLVWGSEKRLYKNLSACLFHGYTQCTGSDIQVVFGTKAMNSSSRDDYILWPNEETITRCCIAACDWLINQTVFRPQDWKCNTSLYL